jgi:hypothetical protein
LLTGEQKIRYEGGFVSGVFGPQIAVLLFRQRLTYIHKREWSMQQPERAIDGSIKPRVVSTRAESDEVLFVLDVLLFRIVQRIVVLDVIPHAAIFGLGRFTRRKQLLCRVQDCGYQRSLVLEECSDYYSRGAHTISVKRTLDLSQQSLPRQDHIVLQRSRMAVGDVGTIIPFESPLKDPQIVLLVKQEPTLQVAKPTVQSKVVAAVLENGQVGISDCMVLYFFARRTKTKRQRAFRIPDPRSRQVD